MTDELEMKTATSELLNMEVEQIDVVNAVSPTVNMKRKSGYVELEIKDIKGTHVVNLYDGVKGDQGASISNVELNSDYTLTIDLTDGRSFTTPSIRGAQGDKGDKGDSGNGIAGIRLNGDYMLVITYSNGAVETVGPVRGEKGDPGEDGITPHITIGEVAEGETAAASITGTDENPVLNLTLPAANVPTKVSELINDSGYLTEEADPTVPEWAKAPTKPSYTASEIGAYEKPALGIPASDIAEGVIPDVSSKLDSSLKGSANGLAELDENGKVPSSQLPSYVDDVLEFNSELNFPVEGESGKIYVALDTDTTYRWSGSAYVKIGSSLALGETAATAYRGDRGAAAYAHAITNKGSAFANGFYKITTNTEGHVTNALPVAKKDITDLGIVSPSVTVTDITGGHRVTITDAEHPQGISFDVMNGETPDAPVQDVQVNGVTVLDAQGVANVPVATTSTGGLGVVQPFANSFVVDSAGQLRIAFAAYSHVKEGTNDYRPITSAKEHAAAFYGLAKAAGDTTQSQSSNEVGQYTDEAKAAIQQMLDVPSNDDIPDVPVQDVQVNGVSVVEDGVANVPKITDYNATGVVQVDEQNERGLQFINGKLETLGASLSDIKGSWGRYRVLTPPMQNASTFYGLAKAAGDTTQSASSNAVGKYTDGAKLAIQRMLGVESIWTRVAEKTVTEAATDVRLLLSKPCRHIFIDVQIEPTSATTSLAIGLYNENSSRFLHDAFGSMFSTTAKRGLFSFDIMDGGFGGSIILDYNLDNASSQTRRRIDIASTTVVGDYVYEVNIGRYSGDARIEPGSKIIIWGK